MKRNKTPAGWYQSLLQLCLGHPITVLLLCALLTLTGLAAAPFGWNSPLRLTPVTVDALPDLGENQQIVFTE